MVRVLVTGAGGGLGRAVAERLRRPDLSLAPAFKGAVETIALQREDLDVTRRDRLEEAIRDHRPEIVLNAAGSAQVDLCESYQWEAFLVNRDAADNLGRACARAGALLVYLSTDLVFDGSKRAPCVEEDPPNPLSAYADSKLAGELAVMNATSNHLILRSGWIYGQPGRHFLRAVQDGGLAGEVLYVPDDQYGQPTYVQDFIDALAFLAAEGLRGTFHVANAGEATQLQATKRLLEALGRKDIGVKPLRTPPDVHRALRPRYSVLSCAKLERAGHRMRPWEAALQAFARSLSGSGTGPGAPPTPA